MAVDAIVRVSFQSNVQANQAANMALVGHVQNSRGVGPFVRVGTAVFSCSNAAELPVATSLATLGEALRTYAESIDFVSITMARRT